MDVKQLAADTRDPVGMFVFGLLGMAGMLGLLPADWSANDLAKFGASVMSAVAGFFALFHHRDLKVAIRAGREAQALAAAPSPVLDDQTTPFEVPPDDGR